MHDHPPTSSKEITSEQIEEFVQKVRNVAPYTGEPIDDFGTYKVDYESGDFDVTIYMPVMAGGIDFSDDEDSTFVSDGMSVFVRQEAPTDDEGYILVHTRQYTVYLADDMIAQYDESSRVYSVETDTWAAPLFPKDAADDLQMLQDYTATKAALGISIFTEERFDEVCTMLDGLKPENKT